MYSIGIQDRGIRARGSAVTHRLLGLAQPEMVEDRAEPIEV
jgi:hypothetical protein